MNWITNFVRPRINSIFSRRETPENLWQKCDECGTMLFHRELSDNLNVCTNCGHHMNLTPRDRFTALFDVGVFTEVRVPEPLADPLHFRDQKKYPDRMKTAQKQTGEHEAMLVATGEIGRTPIVAAAQVQGRGVRPPEYLAPRTFLTDMSHQCLWGFVPAGEGVAEVRRLYGCKYRGSTTTPEAL